VEALRTTEDLSRRDWDRLVVDSAPLADRLATSAEVFARKRWRGDLELWDTQVKPSAIAANEELTGVALEGGSPARLLEHLQRCRENLELALYRHHRFNVAAVIAVGDLLAHAEEWTGRPGTDFLGALRGATPLFLGAGEELTALAAAVRSEPAALAAMEADRDPGEIVAFLQGLPGETGRLARAYVVRVAAWPVGSGTDISDPCLGEVPHVLAGIVRAMVAETPGRAVDDETHRISDAVPGAKRQAFDELLAEARATFRLRDERATFCDVWAFGVMRRAILAAGAHLAARGRIDRPAHLLEARYEEMRSLMSGGGGPSAGELAGRATERVGASLSDAPPFLGPAPRPPIPPEWLPAAAARTERAFRAYVEAMSADDPDPGPDLQTGDLMVRGVAASPGRYEGTARIVHDTSGLARITAGDVLVAVSTSPAYNVVLPILGAIVTDQGGLLSHAAIVAREYRIPAVTGTSVATRRIPDGVRVRVDGDAGEVSAT
jgi:pyruvate,water dikinase